MVGRRNGELGIVLREGTEAAGRSRCEHLYVSQRELRWAQEAEGLHTESCHAAAGKPRQTWKEKEMKVG